jgi:hypothetical protein
MRFYLDGLASIFSTEVGFDTFKITGGGGFLKFYVGEKLSCPPPSVLRGNFVALFIW